MECGRQAFVSSSLPTSSVQHGYYRRLRHVMCLDGLKCILCRTFNGYEDQSNPRPNFTSRMLHYNAQLVYY
jgi:hypothetical protein